MYDYIQIILKMNDIVEPKKIEIEEIRRFYKLGEKQFVNKIISVDCDIQKIMLNMFDVSEYKYFCENIIPDKDCPTTHRFNPRAYYEPMFQISNKTIAEHYQIDHIIEIIKSIRS